MKSKASVSQQLHSVLRSRYLALVTVLVMFVLSGSSLAQGRLPFIGTRTFCGEIEGTTAIISIRKDGFTTIKTNMVSGLGSEPATAPYETFSGMLNAKGILRRGNFYLTIKSGTDINVYAYPNQDNIDGKLCTSSTVLEKSNDIQGTPAAPPNAGSNPPPGARAQSTPTKQIAPDTLVANLYRQAGDGAIVDERSGASSPDRVFGTRSRVLIDKYFDKGFADVMWKALLRYGRMKAYDDPGSFGAFLYGYLGDYMISNGLVGKPSYDGQKAQVIVSFDATNPGEPEQVHKESVVFLLAAGQTGWKITDIKYDTDTLYDDVLCRAGKISLFDEFNMDSKATDAESKIWNAIRCNDVQGFKHYLQKYPNGAYADVARVKIREIARAKNTQPADSQSTDSRPLPLNTAGNKTTEVAGPANTSASRPKSSTIRLGIELVYIQPGSFMMGSTNAGLGEKPAHQVRISQSFYMGKYEVTQAQWQAVMGSNPSAFEECGDNCPVERVSWDDAQEFIRRLNAMNDGYSYRLPTEAEWEYACRAGTTGDYAGALKEMAWFSETSESKTHAVGEKQLNAWGLADMLGNVWEWCQDSLHQNYDGAPSDGSAWLSLGEQKSRVFRGGSWAGYSEDLRSARRSGSYSPATFRDSSVGFRVVAVPRSVKTPELVTPARETVIETKSDSAAIELSYWESIRNSTDPEDFKAYLVKYPNGHFAELAKSRANPARPAGNPASADVTAAERARRVEYPSSRYRSYSELGLFRVSVPENWRELSQGSTVWFAPNGAFSTVNGQDVFTHGVNFGTAKMRSDNLQQATNDFLRYLQQSNRNLRSRGSYQRTDVNGRNALSITLSNVNEATGGSEVVNIVTTQLRSGDLFYVIMVAPESDYYNYQNAFQNILRSLQLNN